MPFPDKKELERARKKLESVEPTHLLRDDASKTDQLKFDLCKQFIIYLRENDLTQAELAGQIGIDPARMSEIVKYKIELFTVDRLLEYVERINPQIKVVVA